MRKIVLLLPLALAACATEQEMCINRASRDLRVQQELINETRGNIARGYALETRTEVTTIEKMCATQQPDGTVVRTPCNDVVTREYDVPKAIDVAAEQAKLDSMLARQQSEAAYVQQARAACVAAYPES